MTTKKRNPKERICLILYEKPMNVNEICKKLYGNRNTKVSGWITELEEKHWIKYIHNYYRFKKGEKKDGRKKYYKATHKGILDTIIQDIPLDSEEKQKLSTYLKTPAFKNYVISYVNSIDFKNINSGFSVVKGRLGDHSLFKDIVNTHIQDRLDIDLTNPVINKMALSSLEKHPEKSSLSKKQKADELKEKVDFDKLGQQLIKKLSNLAPNKDLHVFYYKSLIDTVEATNKLEKELKDRRENHCQTNGNGHGLS